MLHYRQKILKISFTIVTKHKILSNNLNTKYTVSIKIILQNILRKPKANQKNIEMNLPN